MQNSLRITLTPTMRAKRAIITEGINQWHHNVAECITMLTEPFGFVWEMYQTALWRNAEFS
jgi:hypothetical protein